MIAREQDTGLSGEVDFQLSPLKLLASHIDRLTEEAGQRGGKYRTIEMTYDELFVMSQTLTTALDNTERALRISTRKPSRG